MDEMLNFCNTIAFFSLVTVSDGETVNNTQDGEGNQAETSHQAVLPIFNEAILSYYVRQSIHHPACVLFKEPGKHLCFILSDLSIFLQVQFQSGIPLKVIPWLLLPSLYRNWCDPWLHGS